MKIFNNILVAAMLLCVMALPVFASGGCDCSNVKNVPAEIQGWCQDVKNNGTLVSYDIDEKNNTALLVVDDWMPYNQTVDAYFPATKTTTTPHSVTTRDESSFKVELVNATVQTFKSEECAVLVPGGKCEPIIKPIPETEVGFKPDSYQSPVDVAEKTKCYNETDKKKIQVQQPVTGHAKQLVRLYYLVTFNQKHIVEDKAGQPTTETVVGGNPCPLNCDVKKQPGCIPCAA